MLATLTLIPTPTWIRQGPVLAGPRVVWTSDPASVYESAPVRRVWHAGSISVPRGLPNDPRFSYSVGQDISALTASASASAFIRTVELYRIPRCQGTPPCLGAPIRGDPIRRELWTAQARGRFHRTAVATGKGVALDADIDRKTLAYSETVNGESRVVVVHSGRTTTVVTTREVGYLHVAVAGRYVAWIQRSRLEHWPAPPSTVVVYDLAAHRVAYMLGPQELGHAVVSALDLEPDGTVATASDPSPAGGCDGGVAWASVAQPRPHYLSGNAIPWRVQIAAGRIAYFTRSCVAPTPFRLVVKTVADQTLADGVVAYGGFAFDGHRLAYLQSPKAIRIDRLR